MAVTRDLSTLKVNDRLNYATITNNSITTTQIAALINHAETYGSGDGDVALVNFVCEYGNLGLYADLDYGDTIRIKVNSSGGSAIRAFNSNTTAAIWTCSSKIMGKVTSVTYLHSSTQALLQTNNLFTITNINRTYYGLFRRMIQWLERRHSELDYYMSLCSTAITPSFTSAKGTYNTVSDADACLIGNYLCIDFRASMTSSQQTSVGTGDITNRVMGTMTFSNFYYGPDTVSTLTTNAERQGKIYGIQSYNVSALSAYSTGNAHVGQWAVEASVSGHTLTVEFTLCALQGKTSQVRCICWLPVHRCPWIRES